MKQINENGANQRDGLIEKSALRRLALNLTVRNPQAIETDELAALLSAQLPGCHSESAWENVSAARFFPDDAQRTEIIAAIELGRRLAEENFFPSDIPKRLTSSSAAISYCKKAFHRLALDARREEMHVLTLDTKNRLIESHQVSIGTLDASLVHPREVFRPAIFDAASSVILVHNHPSGDPTPSREDISVTDRIDEAGKLLGIALLDHIIVAKEGVISIREYS